MLNLGVETQCIASLPFYTEQARETQSIASLPFYAEQARETQSIASLPFYTEQALRRNALRLYRFTPNKPGRRKVLRLYRFTPNTSGSLLPLSSPVRQVSHPRSAQPARPETQSIASLPFYAEHVTQPSSIEQLGPAGISSTICSTTSGITGSMFLPPWFSTVNLTACEAACVRR